MGMTNCKVCGHDVDDADYWWEPLGCCLRCALATGLNREQRLEAALRKVRSSIAQAEEASDKGTWSGLYKTQDAKDWQDDAIMQLRAQRQTPLQCWAVKRIRLTLVFYLHYAAQSDIDGRIKLPQDAVATALVFNDNSVWDLRARKEPWTKRVSEYVEVTVEEVYPKVVQTYQGGVQAAAVDAVSTTAEDCSGVYAQPSLRAGTHVLLSMEGDDGPPPLCTISLSPVAGPPVDDQREWERRIADIISDSMDAAHAGGGFD